MTLLPITSRQLLLGYDKLRDMVSNVTTKEGLNKIQPYSDILIKQYSRHKDYNKSSAVLELIMSKRTDLFLQGLNRTRKISEKIRTTSKK